MAKDLTNSQLDRQNILNNEYALLEIAKATNIKGVVFENSVKLTKEQVSTFFDIDVRTLERYLEKYNAELTANGYDILNGQRLKSFKEEVNAQFVTGIEVGSKVRKLAVFDFRSFLNLSMLLTESENAKILRGTILDIVIDIINKKTGGATKYINQRDEDFIISYFEEENYRKEFTDSLNNYVNMGPFKYPLYTDKIYISIFKGNSKEYRKILKLQDKDKVRDTFYSEILDLVSAFEYGFSQVLKEAFERKGTKLTALETEILYKEFANQHHWKPLIEKARNKMSSRDLAFRDALHEQLKEYITPINSREFERFLGEKSKELVDRMEDAKEVFLRLKER